MNAVSARIMSIQSDIADDLAKVVSCMSVILRDEPLAKRTTLRVGGPADVYIEPASEEDLSAILKFCFTAGVKFFILGRGSNLLVRDGGFRGVVICLSHPFFNRIEVNSERVICGAGARLKEVSVEARRHGSGGLECLDGIPGCVGGALRMNAGAMGSATFEVIESVRLMDFTGVVRRHGLLEIPVEYRGCPLLKTHVAVSAVFKGEPAPRETIKQRMNDFSRKRWASQPAAPSAGCIFKNPATIPAGRLIDELGLKGTRVGGAVVSAEHGNFIINDGSATAHDVLQLIEILKERAKAARGVDLQTEVEIIGEKNS